MDRVKHLLRRALTEPDVRFIAYVLAAALGALICFCLGDHMAALDHLGMK